jgi:hypothetical protein
MAAVVSDAAVPAHFNIEFCEPEALFIGLELKEDVSLIIPVAASVDK